MSKPVMLLTTIPFSGFYHSVWSDAVDQQEESHAEYEADERQAEEGIPAELRLDQQELQSILFDVTTYRDAYRQIAEAYAEAFDEWAGEQLEMTRKAKRNRYDYDTGKTRVETYDADSIGLQFESMDSPREYNFTTDRIFCHIPLKTVRALFKISKAENHERLKAAIYERHTSRSGFISFYGNDLESWLKKPLQEWDHNEIATLLNALAGIPEHMEIYDRLGSEWDYSAWSNAVDWKAYDSRVQELRNEKAAAMQVDNPDYVPAYRCTKTPDMFAGESL